MSEDIDADLGNADWLKTTWTLPEDTAVPWLRAIGVDWDTPEGEARELVEEALEWPSAAAMPDAVLTELRSLGLTDQTTAFAVAKHLPGQHNQKRHNPHAHNPAAFATSDEDATYEELLHDPGVQAWHDHQTLIVERGMEATPGISGSEALKQHAFDAITSDLLEQVDSDANLRAWVGAQEKAWATGSEQDRRSLYGRAAGRLPPDSLANASDRHLILHANTAANIDHWATSSHSTRADAVQTVVADKYLGGKGDDYLQRQAPGLLRGHIDKELAANRPFHEAFADAQYRQTQKLLSDAGVTELLVARGMSWSERDAPPWTSGLRTNPYRTIDFAPMPSWTTHGATASSFAWRNPSGVGVVVTTRAPAGRILAIPGAGMGHANEQEVVLLGGRTAVRAERVTP